MESETPALKTASSRSSKQDGRMRSSNANDGVICINETMMVSETIFANLFAPAAQLSNEKTQPSTTPPTLEERRRDCLDSIESDPVRPSE
mmetsp:Transcript_11984/g.28426  ORF Transcript_11984/g.28426 Transcript_11984/m.28426 type:complete len:90 (+) Transcript_11984:393-662(+)